MALQKRGLEICKGEQLYYCFMHKKDGQMKSTATFGLKQSEQQMIVGTVHRPIRMMNAPSLGSVEPRDYQPLRINIILDDLR
jgi:hypothetical protein